MDDAKAAMVLLHPRLEEWDYLTILTESQADRFTFSDLADEADVPSVGMIQRPIKVLEDRNLVKTWTNNGSRYLKITQAGKDALELREMEGDDR